MAENGKKRRAGSPEETQERPECFVLMPIADAEGYPAGHFRRVFEDIFLPACDLAGYTAVRADQIRATNLIHLDVLQRLLNAPIAVCDLSSRNPNVLFELGLRQAFDKPVVLVQEAGTPPIFDIAPLRYTEYRRSRLYHEVLEDQQSIAEAIAATASARERDEGVNSLVRILELTRPASLEEVKEAGTDPAFQILRAELDELRLEFRQHFRELRGLSREGRGAGGTADESSVTTDDFDGFLATQIEHALGLMPRWFTVPEMAERLGIRNSVMKSTFAGMHRRGQVAMAIVDGRAVFQLPHVARALSSAESVTENRGPKS